MVAKKMDVPNIGSLLGKIAQKRDSGELPRTDIQRVQPVEAEARKDVEPLKSKAATTGKQENTAPAKAEPRGAGGRPSTKSMDIEYVKISPRIPKALKKSVEIALVEERFKDQAGRSITTLDEIVSLALERLMKSKQ